MSDKDTDAEPAISAEGVTVRYGTKVAVDNVDFRVDAGDVVGLIGPNGAGKTSLLECIEGLRKPATGAIGVFGVDPLRNRTAMAALAGVQLQDSAYPPRVNVDELCRLFAGFYTDPDDVDALLAQFELSDKRKTQVTKLSGGQRQRLSLILALLGRPKIVFLDELTTGLDPEARRMVWNGLRERNNDGLTVVLTSHHMDEVEYLCDRVCVMVDARIVDSGTVAELIERHAAGSTRIVVENGAGDTKLREDLQRLGDAVTQTPAGNRLQVDVADSGMTEKVDAVLSERKATSRHVTASMDDVYVALTDQSAGVPAAEGK